MLMVFDEFSGQLTWTLWVGLDVQGGEKKKKIERVFFHRPWETLIEQPLGHSETAIWISP